MHGYANKPRRKGDNTPLTATARQTCRVDDVRHWPPVTDEGTNDLTDYL